MIKVAIFDYGGTLYNNDLDKLYPKIESILKYLKNKGIKIALVSRTTNPQKRLQQLHDFNIINFFDVIDFIGSEDRKEFHKILTKFGIRGNECIIIGNRIKAEILEGNKLNAITIWIKHGEFADEKPETTNEQPTYTISGINELITLLDKIESP